MTSANLEVEKLVRHHMPPPPNFFCFPIDFLKLAMGVLSSEVWDASAINKRKK